MGTATHGATLRQLTLVHAIVLLAGLAVILWFASPVRFDGWSLDSYAWWYSGAFASLLGAAVGVAEGRTLADRRRNVGGYLVLVAGSLPALWFPLLFATADKDLADGFGSWSDVAAAGIHWTLFVVAATVVASRSRSKPWVECSLQRKSSSFGETVT